ncbi:MAG TPA: TRAP transporter substrate-binding protein DctP [Dactylosporangium sp.]|nr:TRAP transporter substrate-binding protein DctP [Dactylosporangium sp.]
MKAIRGAVAAACVVAALAACTTGAGVDKAGGPGEPVVLTMADQNSDLDYAPAVAYFVERVAAVSDGRLRIEVSHGWGGYGPDVEQVAVRDVAAGKVDLTWVGTRVFDTLGVSSFQALTAPMLIDSYALQQAVMASDMPGQMLHGLEPLGVTGLAVLAGGLRKPIAAKHPLVAPADWRGLSVEAKRSAGQTNTIKALGAVPVELGQGGPSRNEALTSGRIDAFEMFLGAYLLSTRPPLAPYVTANVNLWPFTMALLANPARLHRLTKDQQRWLATAASEATSRSPQLADQDAELVTQACAAGARFVNASAADLDALRQSLSPVTADLAKDPQTKAFIDRIDALKASTRGEPPLATPANCPGAAPSAEAKGADTSALDGVYRWTLSVDDARSHGTANDQRHLDDWYPTTFTATLRDGKWDSRQTADPGTTSGTFAVSGNRMTFSWPAENLTLAFTFTVGATGDLTLTPVLPMDPGDQFVWSTHTWTKIG